MDDKFKGPGAEILVKPHPAHDRRDDRILSGGGAEYGARFVQERPHGGGWVLTEIAARGNAALRDRGAVGSRRRSGLDGRGLNDIVGGRLAGHRGCGLGDPAQHGRERAARVPDKRTKIPFAETGAVPRLLRNGVDQSREPLARLEQDVILGVLPGSFACGTQPVVHAASVSPRTDYAGGVEEPQQREPAVREVPYLDNLSELARRFSTEPAWYWLDGGFDSAASWSYLGAATDVRAATRGSETQFLEELGREDIAADAVPTPLPATGFFGGWIVALGYEFGVALMGLDPASDTADPAFAIRVDVVLAIHHASRRAELRGSDPASLDAWWQRYGDAWAVLRSGLEHHAAPVPGDGTRGPGAHSQSNAFWRQSDEGYVEQVVACTEHIVDGEAYVLCLTDTATLHTVTVDPLELYLSLRAGGGATRGAVIVAGSRALVSASPERFVSVTGRTVATHPIKGTRPRGSDPESDRRLAEELAGDTKERSENLMIVDLMRNDLSKVCVPGTVRVDGFLQVESHPHVHQLVSSVSGELREGNHLADAILAAFPGGSMTGAPKHRAIEILADLEGAPRGLYSGCFGWLDDRGDAELAMTIRSVELRAQSVAENRWEARIGAGGGITADSDPESELREKHLKAAPLLAALRTTAI